MVHGLMYSLDFPCDEQYAYNFAPPPNGLGYIGIRGQDVIGRSGGGSALITWSTNSPNTVTHTEGIRNYRETPLVEKFCDGESLSRITHIVVVSSTDFAQETYILSHVRIIGL
jgi:hypothetical protein